MNDTVPDPQDLRARLAALADTADEAIDLGPASLWLAALDRPQVGLARYEDHLAELRDGLSGTADSLAAKIRALQGLFQIQGYRGDDQTYEDAQNANLIRVIDRRKGLPVSLAILLIHAGESVGWQVVGLSFPYHFLVRIDHGNERAVVDPFNAGAVLSVLEMREMLKSFDSDTELRPEHYQPVSKRDVLIRLQNNLKSRAVQERRFDRAAELLERILLFAPGQGALWRELGILQVACGRVIDAVNSVERYYGIAESDEQRHDAAMLVQKIKSRLN
ncbi:MAG: transglutaminase-like domain-containing protein [Proteobacteria bacterium]|nr:transglutaminase-like domain-containing protein [Pseudomonadota bacterium]MDA1057776.1 transglutaminase-like domain-containing protein [Pseudomonadota bacterium]